MTSVNLTPETVILRRVLSTGGGSRWVNRASVSICAHATSGYRRRY